MEQRNPANAPAEKSAAVGRIPMSVPQQKLQVPDIPGYHLHWMLGTVERIAQARRAGYEFVERGEVQVIESGFANDPLGDGNTDLGNQVSVVAGGVGADGQPNRLVLMKLRQEWWDEDQKTLEARSDALVETLRGGKLSASETGETAADRAQRYIDRDRTSSMFTKRRA